MIERSRKAEKDSTVTQVSEPIKTAKDEIPAVTKPSTVLKKEMSIVKQETTIPTLDIKVRWNAKGYTIALNLLM